MTELEVCLVNNEGLFGSEELVGKMHVVIKGNYEESVGWRGLMRRIINSDKYRGYMERFRDYLKSTSKFKKIVKRFYN